MKCCLALMLVSTVTAIRIHHDWSQQMSRYVESPSVTTLADISDAEMEGTDMEREMLRDFNNLPIMIYKDDAEFISRNVRSVHRWDTETVQHICDEWVKAGRKGNLLDIGANLGTYSLPLAQCMKEHSNEASKVVAIEASPATLKKLRASIRYNEFDNIHLYEYALGLPVEDDSLTFELPLANMGNAHMSGLDVPSSEARKGETIQQDVPLTTLDAIARKEGSVMKNIFLAKVDIEGSELSAFLGGDDFLKNSGPCKIFIEVRYNHEALSQLFLERGYSESTAGDGNAWFTRKDLEQCINQLQ